MHGKGYYICTQKMHDRPVWIFSVSVKVWVVRGRSSVRIGKVWIISPIKYPEVDYELIFSIFLHK